MANTQPLKAGFFDIGNTLGAVSQDADKFILTPFDSTQACCGPFGARSDSSWASSPTYCRK